MIRSPQPVFVIRNYIHNNNICFSGSSDAIDTSAPCVDEESFDVQNDAKTTTLAIVHLVEANGTYMFDFTPKPNYDEIILCESGQSNSTYVDERSWCHLQAFATLIGRADDLSFEEQKSYDLLGPDAPRFVLISQRFVDALNSILPLEVLFSWPKLFNARFRGDLSWKDIRKFISVCRQQVPFHKFIRFSFAHLTFLQFVAFSKLLNNHLNAMAGALPHLECHIKNTKTTSADIYVNSTSNCSVQIGVVTGDDPPPTSSDLLNPKLFVWWKIVGLRES